MALNIETFKDKSEKIIISCVGDMVIFYGTIEHENVQALLRPFFEKLLTQMGDEITLDLQNLSFINSSGIQALFKFLTQRKPNSQVTFLIDKIKHAWQLKSLETFRQFDKEHIIIKDKSRSS
jgi:hypothetical protein